MRSMMKKTVARSLKLPLALSLLLPTLLLGACGQPSTTVTLPPSTSQPLAQPAIGHLYELTISGAGTGQLQTSLRRVGASLSAQDLQETADLKTEFVSSSTFDQNGIRYMQASYRVTNNTGQILHGLSFVPVDADGAVGATTGTSALKDIRLFDGSLAADSAADSISLGGAKTIDANGNVVDAGSGGAYTLDPKYQNLVVGAPAGLTVTPKPAAWVVGDTLNGDSQVVTFSTSYPINANGKLNPYKFTLVAATASDSLTAAQQKALAFTTGVNPVADPNDPNWLGQAIVESGSGDYVVFKTYSANATTMRVEVQDTGVPVTATGKGGPISAQAGADAPYNSSIPMLKDSATNIWYAAVPVNDLRPSKEGLQSGLFDSGLTYGYRAWGPNWAYDEGWTPGSAKGFVSDVDASGNRFNPNKLLLDPYALEITHDYVTANNMNDGPKYTSGAANRNIDTAPFAPRAYLALTNNTVWKTLGTQAVANRINTPQKDDVIYEVHVRGFTKNATGLTAGINGGTYAGAAEKAAYLKSLGVTAVEFLPIQETENDANDGTSSTRSPSTTAGDNYWGYMTTNYFAPDRRYSSNPDAGGPTYEFASMSKAFRDNGIKVITDVVYNHSGEGGAWSTTDNTQANVWSMRGLDNQTYYLLTADKQNDFDTTGTGNTLNTHHTQVQKLIIDSLRYQRNILGVDGFRFDLGVALGNTLDNTTSSSVTNRFNFSGTDQSTALVKVAQAFPNVFLSTEPWGPVTYQIGNFPAGWSEWNGKFRDTFRKAQNKLNVSGKLVTPSDMITRFAGSSDLYQDDGRKPYNSVNFMTVHDGFTLKDLYSCNNKNNAQAWPLGPSDGGTDDEDSWDNGSDAALQRQQARNGIAFMTVSQGVPLINGGDETLRSLNCNNNPYNLDSSGNWLSWTLNADQSNFQAFTAAALSFRKAHPALRRAEFFTGTDSNGNGYKDVQWLKADGSVPDNNWYNNTTEHALAFLIDGTEQQDRNGQNDSFIYVAYNAWSGQVNFNLPTLPSGLKWYRVTDTAGWGETQLGANQFDATATASVSGAGGGGSYGLNARSTLILIAKP